MPSILITGVSSGIGRACANLYATRGYDVTGTVYGAVEMPEGLDERVAIESLDLGAPGSATALASTVLDRYGCPDILLNNAGILTFGPLENASHDDLQRIFQINLLGQLELIQSLLSALRERGSGTIANITSLGGTLTFPFFGAYNATKWAFEGVSEGLWHELKPFGIRVKAIEPGFVQTAIWSTALPDKDAPTPGDAAYAPYIHAMLDFEATVTNRTSPDAAAIEVATAIDDTSARLRYPIAAYARPITRARGLIGKQKVMGFFHRRWMGPNSS